MTNKTRLAIAMVFGMICSGAVADDKVRGFTMNLVNASDDVNFNIASDLSGSLTPNVLSDLHWDNMEIWRLEGNLRYGFGDHFQLLADIGVGVISDGVASERDFLGDNRTLEFSRAIATVDGKHHASAMLGMGWQFRHDFSVPLWRIGDSSKRVAFASDIRFTPVLGYGYSKQEIEFTDGIQLIPDEGSFAGLNSDFDPSWHGVFVGFESEFRLGGNVYLVANTSYWADVSYSATARWNLNTGAAQPESFKASGEGDGLQYEVGINWKLGDRKRIGITYSESDLSADAGSAELITSQGQSRFTRLNNVEWVSRAWRLSFEWRF